MIEDMITINFSDIIDKAASESNGDAVGSVKLALELALEKLKTSVGLSRVSESTIRYAGGKALEYALEYARERTDKRSSKETVRHALIEFLTEILENKHDKCTPPDYLGMWVKTGLICLAVDPARNTVYAYDGDGDEVVIVRTRYRWDLKLSPEAKQT